MPMSGRLLRPRASGTAVHPEAVDWATRVTANGGTVSTNTLAAVSKFCADIEAAGLRDRFYRLNLFCGNTDGSLNAVRTPLYRGPSLSAAQVGNSTDTNVNFAQGDYAENVGLTPGISNATKYLDTGLSPELLDTVATGHVGVWHAERLASGGGVLESQVGATDGAHQYLCRLDNDGLVARAVGRFGATTAVVLNIGTSVNTPTALQVVVRSASNSLVLYRNAVAVVSQTSATTPATHNRSFFVFANNNNGTAADYARHAIRCYTIGRTMTQQQMTNFYNAMLAFMQATGRA